MAWAGHRDPKPQDWIPKPQRPKRPASHLRVASRGSCHRRQAHSVRSWVEAKAVKRAARCKHKQNKQTNAQTDKQRSVFCLCGKIAFWKRLLNRNQVAKYSAFKFKLVKSRDLVFALSAAVCRQKWLVLNRNFISIHETVLFVPFHGCSYFNNASNIRISYWLRCKSGLQWVAMGGLLRNHPWPKLRCVGCNGGLF